MVNISDLIRSSVKRDPSVQPITRTPSQIQAVTSQLGQATPTVRTQPRITRGAPTSSYVTRLLQTSVGRDPSVQPIPRSASQMQAVTRQLSRPMAMTQSSSISRQPTSRGMGGAALPLPAGPSAIPPAFASIGGTGSTRAGVVPPSTLTSRTPGSTAGAFGGESGGLGAAAAVAPASGAVDLGLGGIGDSVSSFGSGIVDTVKEYIPLAIKVILVVIVFKIVLWLLRGRR